VVESEEPEERPASESSEKKVDEGWKEEARKAEEKKKADAAMAAGLEVFGFADDDPRKRALRMLGSFMQ